jgi:SAM-dependent methyltransferase
MDFEAVAQLQTLYNATQPIREIAPDDQMWITSQEAYFAIGASALKAILSGLSLAWTAQVTRILDLPCGHGRVARHFRAAFPGAEMFFCDLDREGAAFCSRAFRGTPVESRPELTEAPLPGGMDLIWVGSLFTHVDEARTARWLTYLASCLAPHGLLVATFHGLFAEKLHETHPMINEAGWQRVLSGYRATGFGYTPYTEFDLGDYGVSLASPAKIISLATAIPDTRVVAYVERGWANNHDVLMLTRNDRLTPF